eukprot:CAMPEP_0177784900 /NCGR_PEP_ID=MMETSP0491_2-20121128/19983_1 /TAXON_ID=63592 /ORGANISM="Tetraselmis chuii, Strain PLY429" /LENGTH=352 /DNA_ID=CAMNT_0019305769 /DNA_START=204 /DNA_END=1264 /DNA_ORIENTATION=+
MGPFCRRFPKAQHWVTPGQWSWPINLPIAFFGVLKAKTLGKDEAPWEEDIDMKILNPPSLGSCQLSSSSSDVEAMRVNDLPILGQIDREAGHLIDTLCAAVGTVGLADYVGFPEVAFFHKRSRSLLLTDSIVYVPTDPPEVIRSENLLDAATDNLIVRLSMKLVSGVDISEYQLVDQVEDNAASRRKGWQRMALQVLFFGPEDIYRPESSFRAVSNKIVVSPIVRKLVYNKIPTAVREWVDSIASDWNFRQVIPCHFAGPVPCSPREFRKAYEWLEAEFVEQAGGTAPSKQVDKASPPTKGPELLAWLSAIAPKAQKRPGSAYFSFPEADMKLLNGLNDLLLKFGVFKVPSQ